MKIRGIVFGLFIGPIVSIGLVGCASLAETGGRVLDGSIFAEKTLASYREEPKRGTRVDRVRQTGGSRKKDGAEFIAIRLDSMPNLRFKGSLPDGEGNFSLNSLDFLSPNISGWNEFTLELSGSGSFVTGDTVPDGVGAPIGALLQLRGPVETLDISEGRIRRGAARLNGPPALTALRNRRERILVIAQWMKEQPGLPEFTNQTGFERYWNPILFPELVRAKKRPAAWTGEGPWVRGEEVKWSRAYTEGVFSEELWPVRNSGTLLRDWEEAAGWIYLEFEWEHILELLSGKIELIKIK
ncbi:hypothetical protein FACS189445_5790 [Spirochaetia bacterium]|nr:hypothetical protein FACS189445_5790 [Spirochaetia bacterium]